MTTTRDRLAALVDACETKGDGAEVREMGYTTYYDLQVVANGDLWLTYSVTLTANWKGRERITNITEHYACRDAGYADDEMSHRKIRNLTKVEQTVEGMLYVELEGRR